MVYELTFSALGSPTRRGIFETLLAGPLAVGQIAKGVPVSWQAVSQHLKFCGIPAWFSGIAKVVRVFTKSNKRPPPTEDGETPAKTRPAESRSVTATGPLSSGEPYSKLLAWIARMNARESFQNTTPEKLAAKVQVQPTYPNHRELEKQS